MGELVNTIPSTWNNYNLALIQLNSFLISGPVPTPAHQIRRRMISRKPSPEEVETKEGLQFTYVFIFVSVGLIGILIIGFLAAFFKGNPNWRRMVKWFFHSRIVILLATPYPTTIWRTVPEWYISLHSFSFLIWDWSGVLLWRWICTPRVSWQDMFQ